MPVVASRAVTLYELVAAENNRVSLSAFFNTLTIWEMHHHCTPCSPKSTCDRQTMCSRAQLGCREPLGPPLALTNRHIERLARLQQHGLIEALNYCAVHLAFLLEGEAGLSPQGRPRFTMCWSIQLLNLENAHGSDCNSDCVCDIELATSLAVRAFQRWLAIQRGM
jgi:hypothetical protein